MYNWPAILDYAAAVVESYDTGVTLRQLYYRLVAAGIIENKQTKYQQLSAKTAEARRAGEFPDLIDLTRRIHRPLHFDSPAGAREWLLAQYRRDRTEGQEWSVYIGVEKNGLTNLLRSWFEDRGIPVFAIGGYSSQSFVKHVYRDVALSGRPAVLLYSGDFDPSGEDINRDFVERAGCFAEVRRVALTEAQVLDYELPPDFGKASDSRAAAFLERYGRLVQVELDALPPDTLRDLYEAALAEFWDTSTFAAAMAQERRDLIELEDAA